VRAERYRLLAKEQFGIRKNHYAINQAVNKIFTFDICREKWLYGSLCCSDAKSCYRMKHLVASICIQKQDISSKI